MSLVYLQVKHRHIYFKRRHVSRTVNLSDWCFYRQSSEVFKHFPVVSHIVEFDGPYSSVSVCHEMIISGGLFVHPSVYVWDFHRLGVGLCSPLFIINEFLTKWGECLLTTVCDEKLSSLGVCPVKRELSWCILLLFTMWNNGKELRNTCCAIRLCKEFLHEWTRNRASFSGRFYSDEIQDGSCNLSEFLLPVNFTDTYLQIVFLFISGK
jgi:hypothetical protein